MKDRVVGYVRVSTQGQVKDGYSLAYQSEEIERYCAANNLELLDIYKDEGISGAKVDEDELTIERDGLQEMLSEPEMARREVYRCSEHKPPMAGGHCESADSAGAKAA